jgi:hypothetical protein
MVNDKWRPSHFEYLLKNFNKRTKELTSVNTKTKTKKLIYDLLYSFIYVSFIVQFSILYLAYWILSLAATSTNSVHNLILYITSLLLFGLSFSLIV